MQIKTDMDFESLRLHPERQERLEASQRRSRRLLSGGLAIGGIVLLGLTISQMDSFNEPRRLVPETVGTPSRDLRQPVIEDVLQTEGDGQVVTAAFFPLPGGEPKPRPEPLTKLAALDQPGSVGDEEREQESEDEEIEEPDEKLTTSPEEVLKKHGLTLQGTFLKLGEEDEVYKYFQIFKDEFNDCAQIATSLNQIATAKNALDNLYIEARKCDQAIRDIYIELDNLPHPKNSRETDYRNRLKDQLALRRTYRNNLDKEIFDRENALRDPLSQVPAIQASLSAARQACISSIIDVEGQLKKVNERYSDLKARDDVKAAIAALRLEKHISITMGSPALQKVARELRNFKKQGGF